MSKRIASLIVAVAAFASPLGAEVRTGTFPSASLGRDVGFAVYLPPSYDKEDRRFPVVYVLHGLFERQDFWQSRGLADMLEGLEAKGEVPEMIVASVNGANSFYVNGPNGKFQDLVTKDQLEYVEANFRVVPGRAGRGLLGVSMGGYGALRIAFQQPEVFRAVATHSAMVLQEVPTSAAGARRGQMAAFEQVFGSPIDAARWDAADPLKAAATVDPKAVPALSFDCGSEDRYGLFAGNAALHKLLEQRGIPHEFGLYPGDHGYEYVRTVLAKSLKFLGTELAKPVASPSAKPTSPPAKKPSKDPKKKG